MIDPRERIWNAVDPLARAYGFKAQRRTNAFLARSETTSVLNLQRSQWGEQFYFNCGVWLNRFGQQLQPKEHTCHVRWRVASLLQDDAQQLLEEALDLDTQFEEPERLKSIARAVESHGLALLAQCDTENNTLALVSRFPSNAFLVHKEFSSEFNQASA